MKVVNLMEQFAGEVLGKQWEYLNLPCRCDICKADVLAITLNNLPTRYVTNLKGSLIVRASFQDDQYLADMLREIAKAVMIVAARPSHE